MSRAGISRQELIDILVKHLPGSQSQRMKKARQLLKEIEEKIIPAGGVLSNLGICPKCLKANWLIDKSGAVEKCMSCGEEYLVIEELAEKGSGHFPLVFK
jgi:hypothetical protein